MSISNITEEIEKISDKIRNVIMELYPLCNIKEETNKIEAYLNVFVGLSNFFKVNILYVSGAFRVRALIYSRRNFVGFEDLCSIDYQNYENCDLKVLMTILQGNLNSDNIFVGAYNTLSQYEKRNKDNLKRLKEALPEVLYNDDMDKLLSNIHNHFSSECEYSVARDRFYKNAQL